MARSRRSCTVMAKPSGPACNLACTYYSCDHFVDPPHLLGNLRERPLAELASGDAQLASGRDKREGLCAPCRGCRWRFACHGPPGGEASSPPPGESSGPSRA